MNDTTTDSLAISSNGGLLPDEADDLRTQVRTLLDEISARSWEVGAILYRIWSDQSHVHRWGFDSWTAWAENELNIDRRKAEYMRRMFGYFTVEYPLPAELDRRLRLLPWTKARLLVGRVVPENAEVWISRAEKCNRTELDRELRVNPPSLPDAVGVGEVTGTLPNAPADPPVEYPRTSAFSLFHTEGENDTQYAIVEAALACAAELSDSDKRGHNLVLICTHFLATNDPGSTQVDKARLLANMAALMGFAVVIADGLTNEVVAGVEVLERIQRAYSDPGDSEHLQQIGGVR